LLEAKAAAGLEVVRATPKAGGGGKVLQQQGAGRRQLERGFAGQGPVIDGKGGRAWVLRWGG
jgi:hypothetical protein